MSVRLTRAERETVIRWSDDPDEPLTVSTLDEREAERLIAAGARVRRRGSRGGSAYWTLEAPREWRRWPRPRAARRLSDEQREALRQRLATRQNAAQEPVGASGAR
jgi:hypothetical protein